MNNSVRKIRIGAVGRIGLPAASNVAGIISGTIIIIIQNRMKLP